MNLAELRATRLHSLSIAEPPARDPSQVVAHLCAMQAQDYAGALWAIGLRTPDARLPDVQRAVAERAIIRTWPMRGTLHCVTAADVHWLLDLLAPRVLHRSAKRHRDLALDAKLFHAAERVVVRALEGGRELTRSELRAQLARAKLPLEGPRLYHCLWYLAQQKLLCFGVPRDKQPTFTLLAERVEPPRDALPREVALATLALRYFTGHGPATVPDLARWAGINLGEARLALSAVEDQLACEPVASVPHYFAPPTAARKPANSAFMLPGFDEYLLGYGDRAAILDPRHASAIAPGGNGVFRPTLLLRGRVVGCWRAAETRREVRVTVEPFAKLSRESLGLTRRALARYGHFMGKPALLGDRPKR